MLRETISGGVTVNDTLPAGMTWTESPDSPGWSISGGVITAGDGTVQITYTAGSGAGVTLGVNITLGECTGTGNKIVTVNPLPNATITAASAVCSGSSAFTSGFRCSGILTRFAGFSVMRFIWHAQDKATRKVTPACRCIAVLFPSPASAPYIP